MPPSSPADDSDDAPAVMLCTRVHMPCTHVYTVLLLATTKDPADDDSDLDYAPDQRDVGPQPAPGASSRAGAWVIWKTTLPTALRLG